MNEHLKKTAIIIDDLRIENKELRATALKYKEENVELKEKLKQFEKQVRAHISVEDGDLIKCLRDIKEYVNACPWELMELANRLTQ